MFLNCIDAYFLVEAIDASYFAVRRWPPVVQGNSGRKTPVCRQKKATPKVVIHSLPDRGSESLTPTINQLVRKGRHPKRSKASHQRCNLT
jgi:hypothetical protein